MRLLLDAHLSYRFVADPLRRLRHDVLSLQEEPALDGLTDEEVLALATDDHRIVVTRNSRDFAPLTRSWAEAGREHGGCILVWSFRHDEHASIVAGVTRVLILVPRQEDWRNLVLSV